MWTNSIVYHFHSLEQSFWSTSTLHEVICYKFCKAASKSAFFKLLDPDPHWEEQLDPDPRKMNADPEACKVVTEKILNLDPEPDPNPNDSNWAVLKKTSNCFEDRSSNVSYVYLYLRPFHCPNPGEKVIPVREGWYPLILQKKIDHKNSLSTHVVFWSRSSLLFGWSRKKSRQLQLKLQLSR